MKNTIITLLLIIGFGVWGYYFYQHLSLQKKVSATAIPTPASFATVTLFPSVTISPHKISQAEDAAGVSQAFANKYGRKVSDVVLTVTEDDGFHLSGQIQFKLAMASGWILAVKGADAWTIIQDGNGHVSCERIKPYHFPKSMVPECLDPKGKLITL